MATRPAILPRALLGLTLTLVVACGGEDESEIVARIGDERITVEDVAGYMQRANYGANLRDVERAVNEMIDAHLVLARARERYEPAPVESLQMAEWSNTLLINQFRQDVVWKDIAVDESKLKEWYDENVGEQVTVDHILIRVPASQSPGGADGTPAPGPADADRAAARQKADSLHAALRAGADFAALAREHSNDPSSASRGGRMEPFGRGDMVAPFEQAAFETPVGQLAPVVESRFGYHILRVVERKKPALDDLREQIEGQLSRPLQNEAEDRYVTAMMESGGLEFYERNIDSLNAMLDEGRPPTAEERDLDLATFNGGRIALGEIWNLYELLPAGNRQAIAQLDQQGMVQALASMIQQKLMLARAEEAQTVLDSLRQSQLDERVDQLLLSAYLRSASQARLEVSDEEARQYYEEHREFYADRPFEEVAQEIRQVLASQRLEELSGGDTQRATLAAIADSQEGAVEVVRNTDTYDQVLVALRRLRESAGIPEPSPQPPSGQPPAGQTPAGQIPAPEPESAP
ncbi:MAG TPA: peptidylprolyl isomerase [Gemmatimonadota bacterium]|nr:peptidylprolyl isomerase [Gemmatimonadota bacterium]